MIISHSKKFVFIHIFKTAGTSIRAALQPYQALKMQVVMNAMRIAWLVTPRPISRKITHKNGRIKHGNYLQAAGWISEEDMRDYFKFAFVRNPWDWTVSLYFYILKEKSHHWYPEVVSMSGFEDFLKFYLDTKPRNQKSFLVNEDGQLMMDFVGRFENLSDDFDYICRRLDIKHELGKKNTSKHKPYAEYYTPEMRDALGAWFESDVKEFNYKFLPNVTAGGGPSEPLMNSAAE